MEVDLNFWKNKRVFLTGHTGFKGAWLSKILVDAGAILTGYALSAPTNPNLFSMLDLEDKMTSIIGDIRNLADLSKVFQQSNPEIVIHLAAQPIVRESYSSPVYTYETNVIGTVNLLECVRLYGKNVSSFLNVTTDKVYHNNEWAWGYREIDPLDGFDPYSNSKSCSELVTHSYKNSFFSEKNIAVSTARAGNVIGGGDFSADRIVPDCVRAVENKKNIIVRNPYSTRPYQHVLEPLFAYMMILQNQYTNLELAGYYNVGPDDKDCVTTGELVDYFCESWGNGLTWENKSEGGPHEAGLLKLDSSKIKATFGWSPRWDVEKSIEKTVQWTKEYLRHGDVSQIMSVQIKEFMENKNV
ncbi:MAG: CDP-glucose 4,6-dehydratase [Streptococcaceae bacterium]|jgi:CDP-glucose 4,6-dehydratase|nr:CDP-glucose 4,6-dehydratase [Streptococcaceae bacterium]